MIPLPRPLAGNSPLVTWLNQFRLYVQACRLRDSSDIRVSQHVDSTQLALRRPSAAGGDTEVIGASVCLVRDASAADVLSCDRLKDDGTGTVRDSVVVAKPYPLRGSVVAANPAVFTWSLQTPQARLQKVGATGRIAEFVDPLYVAGQTLIVAVELRALVATVSGGVTTISPMNVSGQAVSHVDVNVDARRWAPTYKEVEVCVNNITRHLIVPASDPY